MELMNAREAIRRMENPKRSLKGDTFSIQINFYNEEAIDDIDETSFDIDCSKETWRDELLGLWEDFRKENGLPENCVTEAWAAPADEDTPVEELDVGQYVHIRIPEWKQFWETVCYLSGNNYDMLVDLKANVLLIFEDEFPWAETILKEHDVRYTKSVLVPSVVE